MVDLNPGADQAMSDIRCTPIDEDFGAALFQAGLEFVENPESRCPVVLLLDTSRSMAGKPIEALTEGLRTLRAKLLRDPLAR
jgi:hypothetical protein